VIRGLEGSKAEVPRRSSSWTSHCDTLIRWDPPGPWMTGEAGRPWLHRLGRLMCSVEDSRTALEVDRKKAAAAVAAGGTGILLHHLNSSLPVRRGHSCSAKGEQEPGQ
jgi:hypothetical protein